MRRVAPYFAFVAFAVLAVMAYSSHSASRDAGNFSNSVVVGNTALARVPALAGVAHRIGFYVAGDAPELPYVSQPGSCNNHQMASDGGACVDANDGNSWKAVFPNGLIDIRQFGARPDNTTPADNAMAVANAYSASIGACTYVPSFYPGFRFAAAVTLASGGSNCLRGDRIKSSPIIGNPPLGKFCDLNFPGDTNGVIVAANNDADVGGFAICGHAAQSKSAVNTIGLWLKSQTEGVVQNVFLQNFVTCHQEGSIGRMAIRDIFCNDQQTYPNIVNGYPFVCDELNSAGSGLASASQITGGECRAASYANEIVANGTGSLTYFDITQPQGGVPLWRADGIKVRVGAAATASNGQIMQNAPLKICGVTGQAARYDFAIYDISVGGGAGSGGTALFCTQTTASLTSGNRTIAVPSTANYRFGANILAVADHGLPLATTVTNITDATHLVLSKAPYISGTVTLALTQMAVATSGASEYLQACQARNACGYKLEIRFTTAPPNGRNNVNVQWSDPTGFAAFDAKRVSDYVLIQPIHVGGYDVGLKHLGDSDGGIEFRPTYIEILNQCVDIEARPYGDVIALHRIVNDPVPNCPGYIDPRSGRTVVTYNNAPASAETRAP